MQKIKASLLFVAAIVLFLSPLITSENLTKVISIFEENVTVTSGDIMQCEIIKTDFEETSDNYDVLLTQACSAGPHLCYVYRPVSEKCFSFKVRTFKAAHIIFGNTAFTSPGNVEIVLDWENRVSVLRERVHNNAVNELRSIASSGIVNDIEYRGFWVKWLDNELFEIGRENETIPFLQHRFNRKLDINYIGIMSWTVKAEWIIDRVSKCRNSNGTAVQKKLKAESDCIILK